MEEDYSKLSSKEYSISDSMLDAMECLPVMEDLDVLPTAEELSKAIDSLPTGKAPGPGCHSTRCMSQLHELLCQCWKEGAVPQDMRDCTSITLYKNKRDRSNCNNYKGSLC